MQAFHRHDRGPRELGGDARRQRKNLIIQEEFKFWAGKKPINCLGASITYNIPMMYGRVERVRACVVSAEENTRNSLERQFDDSVERNPRTCNVVRLIILHCCTNESITFLTLSL